jgi:hypothetical protein
MIVLIPISRFRVPYETARGRPYSGLEKAVLLAAAHDGATLASLKAAFRVHERLLVEAAVTLVTAGWIAVVGGSETRFVLTAAGSRALGADHDPVSVTVAPAKPQTIVMERVTGQVARHADARSWRKRDLGDTTPNPVIMQERIFRNSLDEAQVQKLLPRDTGQWIRRIGPIALMSRQTHFLPVEVDIDGGQVRGLPADWYDALAGRVLQRARNAAQSRSDVGPAVNRRPPSERTARVLSHIGDSNRRAINRATALRITRDDVRSGAVAHAGALNAAFANARTSIAIASPISDEAAFRRVAEQAANAVRRGVQVDLLFGAVAPESEARTLVAAAKKIGYEADNSGGRALLRVRDEPTGSGASLLLYDDSTGRLVALIGDHPWLSSDGTDIPSVGLAVTHQSVCADLARAVSALWLGRNADDLRWTGPSERWKSLATAAEDKAAAAEAVGAATGNAADSAVELLVDYEIAIPDRDDHETARVGSSVDDPTDGDGAVRGLVLRITGAGAAVIAGSRTAQ